MIPTRVPWREHASLAVIKSARKLFARTPIEKLPLTTTIKTKVFGFGSAGGDVTTNFRGIQLTFPTKDIIIAPGLVGGFYEKIELDVFERLATISETIVDVGANIGLYCCIAADRVAAAGKIVAFEPVPENLGYLRRNLEDNDQTVAGNGRTTSRRADQRQDTDIPSRRIYLQGTLHRPRMFLTRQPRLQCQQSHLMTMFSRNSEIARSTCLR